jgi:hypothetical protein
MVSFSLLAALVADTQYCAISQSFSFICQCFALLFVAAIARARRSHGEIVEFPGLQRIEGRYLVEPAEADNCSN